jgi:hypothetical protein
LHSRGALILSIYAEAESQLAGWSAEWNRLDEETSARVPVVWGHVSEDDEVIDMMMTGLIGNYPNPFNPETVISFQLSVCAYRGVRYERTTCANFVRWQ